MDTKTDFNLNTIIATLSFNFYFFSKKIRRQMSSNVLKLDLNPKAGEHRRSELGGLDVGISARYHWSVARQMTSFPLRHWNLTNLTLQQECYLTNTRAFFPPVLSHGSIMLPPRQPRVFARLSLWQLMWIATWGTLAYHFSQNLQKLFEIEML